jgi:uncharacterized protein
LPIIHTRVGRNLYLHASKGAHLTRLTTAADDGLPVCVTVTRLDGLVLARSQMHHGLNYRSVVVRGRAKLVTDAAERESALTALIDHIIPGRSAESRPPNAQELAATAVLRIPLEEATLKRRSGMPSDRDEDLALPHWAGVVPVTTTFGAAQPAPEMDPDHPVPEHVRRLSAGE